MLGSTAAVASSLSLKLRAAVQPPCLAVSCCSSSSRTKGSARPRGREKAWSRRRAERDSPLLPTAVELPLTCVTAAEGVATTKPGPHARGRRAMRQNASSPELLSAAVLAAADDGKPKPPPAKGVQAAAGVAAGEGSCISVIPTARSGFVTLGTAAGASAYCCRHRKRLPPLEVAVGLLPSWPGDRRCFGSTVPPSVRVVETVAKVAWS
ncbi:uncharacterized protein DS421_10g304110 [Arachis hypogaea]|nr:uncharacterized protein DS421_10g304110 [Arachis hypogaea]